MYVYVIHTEIILQYILSKYSNTTHIIHINFHNIIDMIYLFQYIYIYIYAKDICIYIHGYILTTKLVD